MSFFHSFAFKRIKNFVIGAGASLVMIGALGKINSEPWGGIAITVGLVTEALLFLLLGILPPEKDYYWEKLYPGIDKSDGTVEGGGKALAQQPAGTPLNGEVVEQNLSGMLEELKGMSKSLGSLKALQEVDFSETKEQMSTMNNFYQRMTEAMIEMSETTEGVKRYKENINNLNSNLGSLNQVYGNMLSAMNVNKA